MPLLDPISCKPSPLDSPLPETRYGKARAGVVYRHARIDEPNLAGYGVNERVTPRLEIVYNKFCSPIEEMALFVDYVSGVTPIARSQTSEPPKPAADFLSISALACSAAFSS